MKSCHVTRNISAAHGTEQEPKIEHDNINNINELLNQSSMRNGRGEKIINN